MSLYVDCPKCKKEINEDNMIKITAFEGEHSDWYGDIQCPFCLSIMDLDPHTEYNITLRKEDKNV
jgi:phage FluMu protein Com